MDRITTFCKSKAFIYIMLFLLSLFFASSCNDYDYDLYARFIVGENFFDKGVFNYNDFLSYTPTHKWFDHEYGASLIYYLFFKYLGIFGIVLIQAITLFLTAFFITKTQSIQKHAYPVTLSLMSVFLLIYSHQNPSLIRCHMMSFVFFALFLYILEKTRIWEINGKKTNIIWLIPPLIILWNNLHGGVVSGIGIIAIYMFGALISRQNWQKYLSVFVVSIPLLAINPYGAEYLNFLLSANTKSRVMITEWWDVFANRHILYYYPLFITGAFVVLLNILNFLNKKRFNLTKFLVLVTTLYLGMIHVKLLSLPMIVVFSLYHNEIMSIFDRKKIKILEKLVMIVLFVLAFCIPLNHPNTARTDMNKFPIKEVEFLKINNIKGNLLTEFGLGSYVSYKLYPDNLIYMDGRYEEVYSDEVFDDLMNFEKDEKEWDLVLKKYPTEIILLNKSTPVYKKLIKFKEWVNIYDGNNYAIFIKKENARKNYIMPSDDINYYRKNEFLNKGYFGKTNIGTKK